MKKEKILFVFLILFLNLFFISSSFISFVSAGELRVTQEHPFLVNDSWMSAKNLNVGDELFTIDGKKVRITEIEEVVSEESFSVYNLEAAEYSDFVVCGEDECDNDSLGVVVHNSEWLTKGFHCTNCRVSQSCPFNNWNTGACGGVSFASKIYARLVTKAEYKFVKATGVLAPPEQGQLIDVIDAKTRADIGSLEGLSHGDLSKLHAALGGNGMRNYVLFFRTSALPSAENIPFRRKLPIFATETKFQGPIRIEPLN